MSNGVTFFFLFEENFQEIKHVQTSTILRKSSLTFTPSIPLSTFFFFFTSKLLNLVQFSCSVMSNSWRPHELQYARLPCPSPTPRVHPNPCLLSRWCYPTISSSVVPFSSCSQSFPASRSFPMSQLFSSGGQSIWVSALISVLPMSTKLL